MKIREILAEGRLKLSSANSSLCSIDTPVLDAALLLAEILHCSRESLAANGGEDVSPKESGRFYKLLERRMQGECVAYILGRKEFMGLEFRVNSGVLVPRPETEVLVETALKAGDSISSSGGKNIRVLDLCTGSGAIAVSLKSLRPDWEIWASDISAAALETAITNAGRLLHNTYGIKFIKNDLFAGIHSSFDLIVSNPPYIASSDMEKLPPEVKREPALALDGGKDGLGLIRRIITQAHKYLNQDGRFFLEADPGQMPAIKALLEENGFEKISIHNDLAGMERVISISRFSGYLIPE